MKVNLNKRAIAASAKQAGALSLFHRAAEELEAAAKAHEEVLALADAEARRHAEIADNARSDAQKSFNAAVRVRELIGG